jgi:hypothetical protein
MRSSQLLPLLFSAWVSVSCVCSMNIFLLDSIPKSKTEPGTVSGVETFPPPATLAVSAPQTILGESHRVAEFPGGEGIYLLSPQEDAVVSDPWVDVVGLAPAETVVTLDDEIAVAGADGMFYARIPLEEGLNEILCVASDLEGTEVEFSFFVVYEPEAE